MAEYQRFEVKCPDCKDVYIVVRRNNAGKNRLCEYCERKRDNLASKKTKNGKKLVS